MAQILVLFYSRTGHVASLAEAVAEGVEQAGCEARLRAVPSLTPSHSEPVGGSFENEDGYLFACLLYTSPSPRD